MAIKQAIEKQIIKEISKEKEFAKEHKDNKDNPDKLKHEKEQKDQHKDKHEKDKPEKEKNEKLEKHEKTEKHEKHEQKENIKQESLEHLPFATPDVAAQDPTALAAGATTLKLTDKSIQVEKYFKVEYEKHFKHEKLEYFEKYHKNEKHEFPEYQFPTGPIGDPGPVEQRLAALEASMSQLAHFIPQDLRPDLSKGALKQEPVEPSAPAVSPENQPTKEPEKGKK